MPQFISRTDAEGLIPPEEFDEIITGVIAESVVLNYGRRLPNMQTGTVSMPILDMLPLAYFNNANADPSDTSYKKTSKVAWKNKKVNAEELSVIIPIPENVVADANYDIWDQIRPLIVQAIGAKIDAAVFFGDDAPNVWPTDIAAAAIAAGNDVPAGTGSDLYDALLAEDGVFSKVEEDGYMVTANVSYPSFKGKLRGLRGADGNPIFQRSNNGRQDVQAATNYELAGTPIHFMANGAWDPATAQIISGDFSQLVYSIRQDISFKVLDQAVIQDPADDSIAYNLPQQDMIALRVVMRMGWQVPNPPNLLNTDDGSRYPFALLASSAS